MGFNWEAIGSYEEPEVGLYRLLGEMLQRKATLDDLERIHDFLDENILTSDAWRSIGEALHRTTSGSPAGYDIWAAWTRSLSDIDVTETRQGELWVQFGDEFSEAVVDYDSATSEEEIVPGISSVDETAEGDDDTNVIARSTSTGVLAESATQLLRMVPTGPYSLRIFGRTFPRVDEYAVLTLIKRGLFLGAEVRFANDWIPAFEHPAFSRIAGRLQEEAFRILAREPTVEETEPARPDDMTQPS